MDGVKRAATVLGNALTSQAEVAFTLGPTPVFL